ncbi:MAG: MGMT family protein, partial [Deltaproteobacteria bacterium]|nr:MGMT family protein [Deltaproteobacteria bacterium]
VVPCHRVVGADGGLRGFSACGGTALKGRLLALERPEFEGFGGY